MSGRTIPKRTEALECPRCGRILFSSRTGRYPYHFTDKRPHERIWCVASDMEVS